MCVSSTCRRCVLSVQPTWKASLGPFAMRRSGVRIPSAPPCDLARDTGQPGPHWGPGCWSFRGSVEWLVVAGGVEGEFSDEFAGGGVDDADVEVVDEFEDWGSGVGSADPDVVHAAVDAQAELAVLVDDVVQDSVVHVVAAVGCRGGLGPGGVCGGGGG